MTIEEMMQRMRTVLWFHGEWHACVRGCNLFGKGKTLREALFNALTLDIDDL